MMKRILKIWSMMIAISLLLLFVLNDGALATTTEKEHVDQDNWDVYYSIPSDYQHGILIETIKFYDVLTIESIIQPFIVVDPGDSQDEELVYLWEDYADEADHRNYGGGGFEIYTTYNVPLTHYQNDLEVEIRIGFDGYSVTNGHISCQAWFRGDSPETNYDIYWIFNLSLEADFADEYFEWGDDWDEIGNEDSARCENSDVKVHDNSDEDYVIYFGADTAGGIYYYHCLQHHDDQTTQLPSGYADGESIDTQHLVVWFAGRLTSSHGCQVGLDTYIDDQGGQN